MCLLRNYCNAGIFFAQGDVMICMELMDMSLHDLRILVYERLRLSIPENVLGKIAESVSTCILMRSSSHCNLLQTLKALIYLKTKLNVLHRGKYNLGFYYTFCTCLRVYWDALWCNSRVVTPNFNFSWFYMLQPSLGAGRKCRWHNAIWQPCQKSLIYWVLIASVVWSVCLSVCLSHAGGQGQQLDLEREIDEHQS